MAIGYPSDWRLPGRADLLGVVEQAKTEWLARAVPGLSVEDRLRIERVRSALGVVSAYPGTVAVDRLVTPACYYDLGFVIDDRGERARDGLASGERVRRWLLAEGERPGADAPGQALGWWTLGREFAAGMGGQDLRVLADRFLAYRHALDDETELVDRHGTAGADLWEYLWVRRHGIGASPILDPLPFSLGDSLPSQARSDPHLEELHTQAGMLIVLDNDFLSLGRDIRDRLHNALLIAAEQRRLPLLEAARELARLRGALIGRIAVVERQLLPRHGPGIGWYLTGVRNTLAGMARWQFESPSRWGPRQDLPGGEVLTVDLEWS